MELPHPLAFESSGTALSMGLTPEIALGPRFIKLFGPLHTGKAAAKAVKKENMVSYPFN
jgi:hypothetical protein